MKMTKTAATDAKIGDKLRGGWTVTSVSPFGGHWVTLNTEGKRGNRSFNFLATAEIEIRR